MKGALVEWLLLASLVAASSVILIAENQDASLVVAAYAMISFGIVSKKSALPVNRNLVLFLAILLILILLAYRLMFDITEVQLYIANDLVMRKKVVSYGAWLIQLLMIGGHIGILTSRRKRLFNPLPVFTQPWFGYLVVIAWLPLLANLLLYFMFFRGRAYVDIYTMGHGPVGVVLKTIYLTYGAIILMAVGGYSVDRGFRAMKWLFVGFFVVYGLLLNLRSPLLLVMLLFVYFYGQRVSTRTLILSMTISVLMFAAIGITRDPSVVQGDVRISFMASVFGLGEFADTLRFAIERSWVEHPLWGGGIAGSFLGVTEPIANTYAKIISPDYFAEGGGFGFFMLSDLVVNFGMVGAPVVILLLGFILTRQYYSHRLMSSYVFLPILFANLFAMVRNDLGSTFRGIVYTMLSVMLIRIGWGVICRPTTVK